MHNWFTLLSSRNKYNIVNQLILQKMFLKSKEEKKQFTTGKKKTWKQYKYYVALIQLSSVTQSCPTLCNPKDCSMPGFPVHH